MGERYQSLFRLPDNLYFDGSPVIVAAGALLIGRNDGRVLAQLKLQSISPLCIRACKVALTAYEPNGCVAESINDFQYLDLNVNRGDYFGQKIPIYFRSTSVREYTVAVTEVVFTNGTIWSNPVSAWTQLPAPHPLEQKLQDAEMVKQYSIECGGNTKVIPERINSLWYCACSSINWATEDICHKCRRNYKKLVSTLDEDALSSNMEIRHRKEEAARRKQAAIDAQNARKRKKMYGLFACLAAVIIIFIIGLTVYTQYIDPVILSPMRTYEEAGTLFLSSEYEAAQELYLSIPEYKDATQKAEECVQAIYERDYKCALMLFTNGEYESARTHFEALSGYSDADSYIVKCSEALLEEQYQYALGLYVNGEYDNAISVFSDLGPYKDSVNQIKECQYALAQNHIANKEYESAYELLGVLGEYKDCKQLLENFHWRVTGFSRKYNTYGATPYGTLSYSFDESGNLCGLIVTTEFPAETVVDTYVIDGNYPVSCLRQITETGFWTYTYEVSTDGKKINVFLPTGLSPELPRETYMTKDGQCKKVVGLNGGWDISYKTDESDNSVPFTQIVFSGDETRRVDITWELFYDTYGFDTLPYIALFLYSRSDI